MYGTYKKGFTLIEVLIALSIIAVSFTFLLEMLSTSASSYGESENRFKDFLTLDRKLKEGNHEGLTVERKRVPDFPRISEVVYHYKGLFFVRFEAK